MELYNTVVSDGLTDRAGRHLADRPLPQDSDPLRLPPVHAARPTAAGV